MAPLWRLASAVLSTEDHGAAARQFLGQLDADANATEVLAPMLPDSILTISYSSTLIELIRVRGPARTLCMASDPGGEGVRLANAIREWTEPLVIADADAIEGTPAEAVVTGADAVTPRAVINKVKTRELAHAARAKGIPRYCIAGEMKFFPAQVPLAEPFEPVPLPLFTGVATRDRILSPQEAGEHAAQVPLHPAVMRLLTTLM
jgi:translation initiation factor 2B subunit (eIF-2B alpha/beta/delta family)